MVEYWIAKDKERKGPLKAEELISAKITPDTLVWRDGLPTWVKAEELEELAWLFSDELPPEVPVQPVAPRVVFRPTQSSFGPVPSADRPTQPPTYIGWSIAALVLCCTIPAIIALIMGSRVSSRYLSGDYDGAKRASESAELWLIVAIVAGLVWAPFSLVIQLMSL